MHMNGTSFISEVRNELQHLRAHWWWFLLLGVLLVVCGTAAIVFPLLTVLASVTITIILGVLLMVGGVATIVAAFYAGRWSGFLVQLLVGILYVVAGFVFAGQPENGLVAVTMFIALSFIVLGTFRTLGSLVLQFPQWGWALLNGVVTLLAGVIIFRHLPQDALWVPGLLLGLEMLFNGWTWIMLSTAIRRFPGGTT